MFEESNWPDGVREATVCFFGLSLLLEGVAVPPLRVLHSVKHVVPCKPNEAPGASRELHAATTCKFDFAHLLDSAFLQKVCVAGLDSCKLRSLRRATAWLTDLMWPRPGVAHCVFAFLAGTFECSLSQQLELFDFASTRYRVQQPVPQLQGLGTSFWSSPRSQACNVRL